MFFSSEDPDTLWLWYDEIIFNVRRISKLLLRGKFGDVVYPKGIEGPNNLERLVKYTNKHLSGALQKSLNTTFNELATSAKQAPKDFIKNLICLAPNLMRLAKSKRDQENKHQIKKRYARYLEVAGRKEKGSK